MLSRSVACALFLSVACLAAHASPGDPFVPAHRTKDGQYVPPNVPPMSAGTRYASHPGTVPTARKPARQPRATTVAPVSADTRAVPK